jgi:hypothetical protein
MLTRSLKLWTTVGLPSFAYFQCDKHHISLCPETLSEDPSQPINRGEVLARREEFISSGSKTSA